MSNKRIISCNNIIFKPISISVLEGIPSVYLVCLMIQKSLRLTLIMKIRTKVHPTSTVGRKDSNNYFKNNPTVRPNC